jgi:CubicO group peptidase (beta-lactamase class C family)
MHLRHLFAPPVAVLVLSLLHAPPAPGQAAPNAAALDRLMNRARATDSDAVIVVHRGKTLVEDYFGKPKGRIEAMSATKSIVALAIGRLLSDGRIKSLDAPVHTFYPEWNQGRKAHITIRHLLTHRAGLQCDRITTEIYRSPDFVQLALAADLTDDPGVTFRYNNKSCNLLAGVVQKASGIRMDTLIGDEIFKPMGITDFGWSLDKAGNPHAMSGLQILPADLVKLGRLMMNNGKWNDKQILPASFVAEAVRDQITPPPSDPQSIALSSLTTSESLATFGFGQHYGLLWWVGWEPRVAVTERLLAEWKRTDAPESFVAKMATLKGLTGVELDQRMQATITESEFMEGIGYGQRIDWDVLAWNDQGFSAEGYLGQYLVVWPEHELIGVRMRRAPKGEFDDSRIDHLKDFKNLVRGLVRAGP